MWRDTVTNELQDLAQRIADNISRNGQRASGRTQRSFEVKDEGDTITLYGRKAFGTMETGRRGGRVPRNFREILYEWSIDKGIQFDTERERASFAYLLAKKIQKEGTELFREGGRADVYSNEIPPTIVSIQQKMKDLFITKFKSIKLNLFKNEK